MEADLLGLGIELMLAGMAVVFVFLTLLVAATTVMSRIVMRFRRTVTPPEEEIAAISAAISRHRGDRQS